MDHKEKYDCFMYLLKVTCGLKEDGASDKLKKLVRECVCDLSELDQSVIFLRFWKSYDLSEIAFELRISIKQVQVAYTRGLSTLRHLIMRGLEVIPEQKGQRASINITEPSLAI